MRTRSVDRHMATNYLKRAEQCRNAAMREQEAEEWDAVVINAIHAAISAADAVCVIKKGVRNAGESHTDEIALLMSIDPANEDIKRAVHHLSSLLSIKTDAEYGDRLSNKRDAEDAIRHSERLLSFARSIVNKHKMPD